MRGALLIVLSLIVGQTLIAVAPGGAAASATVDAGESVRTLTGAPFTLSAHAEGFDGAPVASWSAPEGCAVEDPASWVTTATCATAGIHAFTFSATDNASLATDTVRVIVEERLVLASASGHVTAGVLSNGAAEGAAPGSSRVRVPFNVPEGATEFTARLDWTKTHLQGAVQVNDFDLRAEIPGGALHPSLEGATFSKPEVLRIASPEPGLWNARVQPYVVVDDVWTLTVTATRAPAAGLALPAAVIPPLRGVIGEAVTLEARVVAGEGPFTIRWERDAASRAFDDGEGATFTFAFEGSTVVRAKVEDANGLETVAYAVVHPVGTPHARAFTVIGVIDSGFTPYHYDFVGHQHPWNTDADATNDWNFYEDPANYIDGFPGATPVWVTIPTSPIQDVSGLRNGADATEWAKIERSSLATGVNLYWFPGTKIIGAAKFTTSDFYGDNSAHGTRSAASAGGNIHGTCPECLFVLIRSGSTDALKWAAEQDWIDVLTNSYGAGLLQSETQGLTRSNVYFGSPVQSTRAGVESGQTIVFSAGNGFVNAFDAPMFTYWSSEKGPDWMVTVGAVSPGGEQTYSGAGKPVDISSIGSGYPSSGGTTPTGTGTHSGTSNAAPTVAGYFAKVLQASREALGDDTVRHANGIVAAGAPVPCAAAFAACPLGDGVLTRAELQDLVFKNALPSPLAADPDTVWPSTPFNYYYQGHGTLIGRLDEARYAAEWQRMVAVAKGEAAPPERPEGEANWFVVDSKCRQKLWGAWNGGYYTGVEPQLDPVRDPIATAFDAWCGKLENNTTQPLRAASGNPE